MGKRLDEGPQERPARTPHHQETLKRLLDVFFLRSMQRIVGISFFLFLLFYLMSFFPPYTLSRFELELEIYVAKKAAFEKNCRT